MVGNRHLIFIVIVYVIRHNKRGRRLGLGVYTDDAAAGVDRRQQQEQVAKTQQVSQCCNQSGAFIVTLPVNPMKVSSE